GVRIFVRRTDNIPMEAVAGTGAYIMRKSKNVLLFEGNIMSTTREGLEFFPQEAFTFSLDFGYIRNQELKDLIRQHRSSAFEQGLLYEGVSAGILMIFAHEMFGHFLKPEGSREADAYGTAREVCGAVNALYRKNYGAEMYTAEMVEMDFMVKGLTSPDANVRGTWEQIVGEQYPTTNVKATAKMITEQGLALQAVMLNYFRGLSKPATETKGAVPEATTQAYVPETKLDTSRMIASTEPGMVTFAAGASVVPTAADIEKMLAVPDAVIRGLYESMPYRATNGGTEWVEIKSLAEYRKTISNTDPKARGIVTAAIQQLYSDPRLAAFRKLFETIDYLVIVDQGRPGGFAHEVEYQGRKVRIAAVDIGFLFGDEKVMPFFGYAEDNPVNRALNTILHEAQHLDNAIAVRFPKDARQGTDLFGKSMWYNAADARNEGSAYRVSGDLMKALGYPLREWARFAWTADGLQSEDSANPLYRRFGIRDDTLDIMTVTEPLNRAVDRVVKLGISEQNIEYLYSRFDAQTSTFDIFLRARTDEGLVDYKVSVQIGYESTGHRENPQWKMVVKAVDGPHKVATPATQTSGAVPGETMQAYVPEAEMRPMLLASTSTEVAIRQGFSRVEGMTRAQSERVEAAIGMLIKNTPSLTGFEAQIAKQITDLLRTGTVVVRGNDEQWQGTEKEHFRGPHNTFENGTPVIYLEGVADSDTRDIASSLYHETAHLYLALIIKQHGLTDTDKDGLPNIEGFDAFPNAVNGNVLDGFTDDQEGWVINRTGATTQFLYPQGMTSVRPEDVPRGAIMWREGSWYTWQKMVDGIYNDKAPFELRGMYLEFLGLASLTGKDAVGRPLSESAKKEIYGVLTELATHDNAIGTLAGRILKTLHEIRTGGELRYVPYEMKVGLVDPSTVPAIDTSRMVASTAVTPDIVAAALSAPVQPQKTQAITNIPADIAALAEFFRAPLSQQTIDTTFACSGIGPVTLASLSQIGEARMALAAPQLAATTLEQPVSVTAAELPVEPAADAGTISELFSMGVLGITPPPSERRATEASLTIPATELSDPALAVMSMISQAFVNPDAAELIAESYMYREIPGGILMYWTKLSNVRGLSTAALEQIQRQHHLGPNSKVRVHLDLETGTISISIEVSHMTASGGSLPMTYGVGATKEKVTVQIASIRLRPGQDALACVFDKKGPYATLYGLTATPVRVLSAYADDADIIKAVKGQTFSVLYNPREPGVRAVYVEGNKLMGGERLFGGMPTSRTQGPDPILAYRNIYGQMSFARPGDTINTAVYRLVNTTEGLRTVMVALMGAKVNAEATGILDGKLYNLSDVGKIGVRIELAEAVFYNARTNANIAAAVIVEAEGDHRAHLPQQTQIQVINTDGSKEVIDVRLTFSFNPAGEVETHMAVDARFAGREFVFNQGSAPVVLTGDTKPVDRMLVAHVRIATDGVIDMNKRTYSVTQQGKDIVVAGGQFVEYEAVENRNHTKSVFVQAGATWQVTLLVEGKPTQATCTVQKIDEDGRPDIQIKVTDPQYFGKTLTYTAGYMPTVEDGVFVRREIFADAAIGSDGTIDFAHAKLYIMIGDERVDLNGRNLMFAPGMFRDGAFMPAPGVPRANMGFFVLMQQRPDALAITQAYVGTGPNAPIADIEWRTDEFGNQAAYIKGTQERVLPFICYDAGGREQYLVLREGYVLTDDVYAKIATIDGRELYVSAKGARATGDTIEFASDTFGVFERSRNADGTEAFRATGKMAAPFISGDMHFGFIDYDPAQVPTSMAGKMTVTDFNADGTTSERTIYIVIEGLRLEGGNFTGDVYESTGEGSSERKQGAQPLYFYRGINLATNKPFTAYVKDGGHVDAYLTEVKSIMGATVYVYRAAFTAQHNGVGEWERKFDVPESDYTYAVKATQADVTAGKAKAVNEWISTGVKVRGVYVNSAFIGVLSPTDQPTGRLAAAIKVTDFVADAPGEPRTLYVVLENLRQEGDNYIADAYESQGVNSLERKAGATQLYLYSGIDAATGVRFTQALKADAQGVYEAGRAHVVTMGSVSGATVLVYMSAFTVSLKDGKFETKAVNETQDYVYANKAADGKSYTPSNQKVR
ncbi:MAG: hypothetical protein PHE65_06860, partial [Candidatus Omnitrophica bacterium]|nr:hypothetical protein [Candidatus Omnitrophota bacterium]